MLAALLSLAVAAPALAQSRNASPRARQEVRRHTGRVQIQRRARRRAIIRRNRRRTRIGARVYLRIGGPLGVLETRILRADRWRRRQRMRIRERREERRERWRRRDRREDRRERWDRGRRDHRRRGDDDDGGYRGDGGYGG